MDAGLEVAAYQIVADALDNVQRHAEASTCQVRLHLDAWALEVEVLDDGSGITGTAGGGVSSMLRAAEDVDGTLVVLPRDPRGTRVHAVLPRLRIGRRPVPDDAPLR
jgi:signal transduction histidine kinase